MPSVVDSPTTTTSFFASSNPSCLQIDPGLVGPGSPKPETTLNSTSGLLAERIFNRTLYDPFNAHRMEYSGILWSLQLFLLGALFGFQDCVLHPTIQPLCSRSLNSKKNVVWKLASD